MDVYDINGWGFLTITTEKGEKYFKDMQELVSYFYGFSNVESDWVVDEKEVKTFCEYNDLNYKQFLRFITRKSPDIINSRCKANLEMWRIERNMKRFDQGLPPIPTQMEQFLDKWIKHREAS